MVLSEAVPAKSAARDVQHDEIARITPMIAMAIRRPRIGGLVAHAPSERSGVPTEPD